MKKLTFTTSFAAIILLFSITKIANAQYWNSDGYNIWNNNDGDVMVTNSLSWGWSNSLLSTDQGGSIELGLGNPYTYNTPFIDFHYGGPFSQDFNTRIINSADNRLEFKTGNGSALKFDGKTTRFGYTLPSLNLTNSFNNGNTSGNSLVFQNAIGSLGIDFWNFGSNGVIDIYADYNNPNYDQLSIKSDNSVAWGNDWSWLLADQGGEHGASIHLNQAGTNSQAKPYIGFTYGRSEGTNRIDVGLKCSGYDQLDFFTNMNGVGEGGTKRMTINDNGVFATKITVKSSWSDFVFKPEYKLNSLDEVEKYIKENGHLEGMPSEQEVKENGVELGEATSKLLQKIEELTLYVIEQNKKIEKLEIENKNLEGKLSNESYR
jgi:hypothetical protein